MQWIKITSGSFTQYIPMNAITRAMVSNAGTLTVYMGNTSIANYPVTDWNNGRLLDENFADLGTNPFQV